MDKSDIKKQRLFDEGCSWFRHIEEEFTRIGGITPDEAQDRLSFFWAIGLLGRLADLETDDVDYIIEEE